MRLFLSFRGGLIAFRARARVTMFRTSSAAPRRDGGADQAGLPALNIEVTTTTNSSWSAGNMMQKCAPPPLL